MPDEPLPPLLVRADGGPGVGLGHVLRSLALAEGWRERGGRVEWLGAVAAGGILSRLAAGGIRCHAPGGDAGSPADLHATLSAARGLADEVVAPWVLLDGYAFGPGYQQGIRDAGFRVLLLDDVAHQPTYAVDVILNQNLRAEEMSYPCAADTVLLLGAQYALLRREFRATERRAALSPRVGRVLVTMGGADPGNVTAKVIEALDEVRAQGLEALVVVGPANPHREELQRRAAASRVPVQLAVSPEKLPRLMADADLAISAGGSTCWELAFLGVPFVVVQLADNQVRVAQALHAAGAAVDAGWHASLTTGELASTLSSLCSDPARRRGLREAAMRLVDGRGWERVLSVLAALGPPTRRALCPRVRRATWDDRFQLWRLANESQLRASSFDRPEIPLERHLEWFRGKLEDVDTLLLVLDVGGVVAGQLRYDRHGPDRAEVHFAVAPGFRGRGLGTRALRESWKIAVEELQVQRIEGAVLRGNAPSERAFRSAGYELLREEEVRGFVCNIFVLNCERR